MLQQGDLLVELSVLGALIDVVVGHRVVLLPGLPLDVVDVPELGVIYSPFESRIILVESLKYTPVDPSESRYPSPYLVE